MIKPKINTRILVLLMACFVWTISVSAQEAKKNVLLIMIDDFNHWIEPVGYYPDALTPNINRLASKGVLFSDASSSSPVCLPSRSAILSGIHPITSGISSNAGAWIREVPDLENVVTLNKYYKENGYYTYGGGKIYHPGSMGSPITDPENWTELYTEGTGSPGGPAYKVELATNSAYKWGAGNFDIETANDTKLARHFAEKISNYDRNEPFFMAMGLFRPHLPWNCHKNFFDMYDPEQISFPAGYLEGDNNDICHSMADTFKEIIERGLWKEALRAYLANLSFADFNVGIVMESLEKSPLKENTIIVLVGDHGWQIGEKERMSKHAVFDQASRTTMIILDPSAAGNGQISRKVVSLQDIYPTLISLTGLPSCPKIQGNDISPLLQNPNDDNWEKPIFIKYADTHIIKTNKWRFIDDGNCSQLYNMVNDPYEFENLYKNEAFNDTINNLRGLIQQQVLEGNEIRKITDCIPPDTSLILNVENVNNGKPNLLFPNPSKDFVSLPGVKSGDGELVIYDLSGIKIHQQAKAEINVS